MSDVEREVPLDDVEITDLDRPAGPVFPRRPRLTPRQRRISLVLTVALFIFIIGLLLNSASEVRGLLARTFAHPTSTIGSNDLPVYVRGNPSWGQFTLDGHALARPPLIGKEKPVILPPGLHTLTWHAAPFKPQRCTFTIIDSMTVRGPCFFSSNVIASYEAQISGMVMSFFASSNDLPVDQHAALLQQIQQAVASYGGSEIVRPGEAYAVSEQAIEAHPSLCSIITRLALCFARANQLLRASLRLQMDTSTSPNDPCVLSEYCSMNHQDCRAICDDPSVFYTDQVMEGWSVDVVIRPSWSYTTLAGQVVARDQPDSAIRGDQGYQIMPVHITRDGQGWHVFPFPKNTDSGYDDPLCNQSGQDITQLTGTPNNQNMGIQQLYDAPDHVSAGCLAVLRPQPQVIVNPRTPSPGANGQPVAYFLARFGVVLAVNDTARQLWSYLPVADAYEKGLAQQLLSALPPSA